MSYTNRAGLLANIPGVAGANMPQDCFVFFEDFLGSRINVNADLGVWNKTLVYQTGGVSASGVEILDMADTDFDESGGILQITTEATVDDGENLQVNGEAFHIKDGYPLYFETRIASGDISNLDFFIGLSKTDPEIMYTGIDDGIGFQGEAAVVSAITAEGSTEELTTIKPLVDKTLSTPGGWMRFAFWYDGDDTITFYQDVDDDGTFDIVATRTVSKAAHDVPEADGLTPTIEAINGDTAAADVFWCDYVLCAQARYKKSNVG